MTSSSTGRAGQCLCGAVRFRLTGPVAPVLHCHCENCRRHSGNFVAAARVDDNDLDIDDPSAALQWHELPLARYGFCGQCGSSLFFKASDAPQRTSVMVGTIEDVTGLDLAGVWFAGEAQPHHLLSSDVPHHAGGDT